MAKEVRRTEPGLYRERFKRGEWGKGTEVNGCHKLRKGSVNVSSVRILRRANLAAFVREKFPEVFRKAG